MANAYKIMSTVSATLNSMTAIVKSVFGRLFITLLNERLEVPWRESHAREGLVNENQLKIEWKVKLNFSE